MKKLLSNAILLCLVMSSAAYSESESQEFTPQPVTIAGSVTHVLNSEKIDQSFKIDVALPSSYPIGDRKYPVVYVTDGGGNFPIVVGNLRMLSLGFEMPDVIVVGIGYNTSNIPRILAIRTRDLTPTNDEAYTKNARNSPMFPLPADVTPGGADDFVDFIDLKLKPFINTNYRADSDNETLIGYSLGGLFGLHVLFNHTDSFDKYVIGSPSVWWDNTVSFTYEAEYARHNKDLAKKVFMSTGGLEEASGDDNRMVTNMIKMFTRLNSRHYPGLVLDHYVFAGETHMSGMGTAFNRGLRFLFKDEMPTFPGSE
ncbi:MAG: alpha/beta hydrolase-fold protein [Pseudomonadales bacterium]|nr:alpha/beta hydrolase-fold protein [Pseudomonadales bacterium]MDP7596018.1 alpha/beta hydrolase-fold protein [Pseudomonadales bacterium]